MASNLSFETVADEKEKVSVIDSKPNGVTIAYLTAEILKETSDHIMDDVLTNTTKDGVAGDLRLTEIKTNGTNSPSPKNGTDVRKLKQLNNSVNTGNSLNVTDTATPYLKDQAPSPDIASGDKKSNTCCELEVVPVKPLENGKHSGLYQQMNGNISSLSEKKVTSSKPRQLASIEWLDGRHQSEMIHCLNVFRKSRQFCDLVLLVGGHEIYCHRVVVAGASPAILNELCSGEQESGPVARIAVDAHKPGLSLAAVEILIEYMYTSRLVFAPEHLIAVYRASLQLDVERVVAICRRHVTATVDPDQCIQVRRLAQMYGDGEMKHFMNCYIEENFEAVTVGNEFLTLPRIKIEIVPPSAGVFNLVSISLEDDVLSSAALLWISNVIKEKGGSYLEDLTEQIQRIPADELSNVVASSSSNGHSPGHQLLSTHESGHRKAFEASSNSLPRNRLTRSSSMDSIETTDSADSFSRVRCDPNGEWKVLASLQAIDTERTISLCSVGDVLCALSIHLPQPSASPNGETCNGVSNELNFGGNFHISSVSSSSASCSSSVGSNFQFSSMNQPRSAAGVAQIDGKVVVAGGFNQSESLDTVECFDVSQNRWSLLSRMGEKRGRFSVAVLDGLLYAVGGSTGSHNLNTVECYDPVKDTWTHVQPLQFCCSEVGVAALNGKLYCAGGVRQNTGIAGLKACQAYDPTTDQWEYCASMKTARSSLGVAAFNGHLYAVAGSDGWKCLNSAEKYDPVSNQWSFAAPLNTCRRGLGLIEHNGSLYCVGGSDGHVFLSSVERYCPAEGDLWTLTNWSLSVPRNNTGLASTNAGVFVVGGFSGRHFLASVEVIEDSSVEWPNHESSWTKGAATQHSKDGSSSSGSND